jgi:hypothetical protein
MEKKRWRFWEWWLRWWGADLVLLVLGLGGDGGGDGGPGGAHRGGDGAGVGGDRLEAGRYDPQRAGQQPIPPPLPSLHPFLIPGNHHRHEPLRLRRRRY